MDLQVRGMDRAVTALDGRLLHSTRSTHRNDQVCRRSTTRLDTLQREYVVRWVPPHIWHLLLCMLLNQALALGALHYELGVVVEDADVAWCLGDV